MSTETDTKVVAELRENFGKGYARRLRKAGKIPAVIYGHGAEPVHIALPGHETMLAARNPNAVLSVDVDGTNHLTLIKDVQRHAIRPEIYHVDLLTVRRGERVEVEVPVVVEGEVAPGNISTQSESVLLLDVDALDVPEELLVDVTDRQAFQFHWLRIQDIPEILDRLETVGLHTKGACGDTVRAVIASPLAGLDAREKIDVRPLAAAMEASPAPVATAEPAAPEPATSSAAGASCPAAACPFPSLLLSQPAVASAHPRRNCSRSLGISSCKCFSTPRFPPSP